MSRVRPGWEGQWIIGPAGCQVLAPFVDIKGSGIRTISSLDSYWRQCWSRLALPMRRRWACPVSRVHTQRSQRSSLTRCSVQAASSSWDQTRLWQPLYRGCCRVAIPCAPCAGRFAETDDSAGEHDGGEEIFHLNFLLVLGTECLGSALAAHNESKDTIRHVKSGEKRADTSRSKPANHDLNAA